jgi:hypothetical protein
MAPQHQLLYSNIFSKKAEGGGLPNPFATFFLPPNIFRPHHLEISSGLLF